MDYINSLKTYFCSKNVNNEFKDSPKLIDLKLEIVNIDEIIFHFKDLFNAYCLNENIDNIFLQEKRFIFNINELHHLISLLLKLINNKEKFNYTININYLNNNSYNENLNNIKGLLDDEHFEALKLINRIRNISTHHNEISFVNFICSNKDIVFNLIQLLNCIKDLLNNEKFILLFNEYNDSIKIHITSNKRINLKSYKNYLNKQRTYNEKIEIEKIFDNNIKYNKNSNVINF